ncbi:hypothetical protein C8J56DRAFT_1032203 [Mycena floridula]|nr:hypothetical protein C8J56DRAFT_1032203 [Mycena floridula]
MMLKWPKRLKDICPTTATTADISRTSLVALKESSDAFPPLKSVCGGVLAIWDTVERLKSCKSEARALADRCKDILEHLADAVQPDPAHISPALMHDISRFQRLLDNIRASMEQIAKMPTGTSRALKCLKGLKGLKRLNRDEAELKQSLRHLDEAVQSFLVAMAARAEVSMTRIGGSTTRMEGSMTRIEGLITRIERSTTQIERSTSRIESSTTRTELSTAQIQLSASNLGLSVSHIESNVQALQKDFKRMTVLFVMSLAYVSAGSLESMTSSHSPEIRVHMGCSGP